jgi:putative component of membrane protein insertase Oxa1/YidC/SpoIIIJ protein YidD
VIICLLLLSSLLTFNCNWVDTQWQYNSTHLLKNSTQNTENGTYITIKKIGKCGPCPVIAGCTPAFAALQLRKKHRKSSVRVVKKCPDIPVAVYIYRQISGSNGSD